MSEGGKDKSKRAGDDTRARIDDLKGGWSLGENTPAKVPAPDSSPPVPSGPLPALPKPKPTPKPVKKSAAPAQKGKPPPPPPAAKRAKSVSAPPPIPGAKGRPGSKRRPTTKAPPIGKAPPVGKALPIAKAAPPKEQVVAQPKVIVESSESRDDDSTLHKSSDKRSTIEDEELMIPAAPTAGQEVDEEAPTRVAASFNRQKADAAKSSEPAAAQAVVKASTTPAKAPQRVPQSLSQLPDTIPRKAGIQGDIAYLFRVLSKRREARKEIESLEVRITSAKEIRHAKLVDMARLAVGDDAFDQTMVGRARTSLLEIEEKRSQHAGRVAAVDEKLGVLERSRDEREKERGQKRSEIQLEIDAVLTSMEPLKLQAAAARKRAAALKRHLQALDGEIRSKESSTVAVAGPADQASVNAEIASLKAERDAVASDQPAIVADIDHVEPQIAKLRADRDALQVSIAKLETDKVSDAQRIDEKVSALKAGRVVEDRLVNDQTSEKEARLLELGEEMHKKPPEEAELHAKGLERQDLEIAALESRRIELKDLLLAVEKPAMIRGGVWIGAAFITLIALAALLIAL